MLRMESLSLMACRHFLHRATDEWTYRLENEEKDRGGKRYWWKHMWNSLLKMTTTEPLLGEHYNSSLQWSFSCSPSILSPEPHGGEGAAHPQDIPLRRVRVWREGSHSILPGAPGSQETQVSSGSSRTFMIHNVASWFCTVWQRKKW